MKKISMIEYGSPKEVTKELTTELSTSSDKLIEMINITGERVKELLGFSQNPISINRGKIRVIDFAGILRVGSMLEIEVAPKFLGVDSDNRNWREDFFYLATLSRNGMLLNSDRLSSSRGDRGDLYTLIARAFVDMYWENYRYSLRTYSNKIFIDFSIDGDIEPESLIYPEPEGFIQTKLVFDQKNHYNAIIVAAAKQLLSSLKEPSLSLQMIRIIQALSPQDIVVSGNIKRRKLPSRLTRWQQLYDLSIDILKGFGLVFQKGSSIAPGYVLDTWRVWEDFLSLAIKRGFGIQNVKQQTQFILGQRQRNEQVFKKSNVNVRPDLVVSYSEGSFLRSFVFDAKYKGHVERGAKRIAEQDIYESMAFAKATGCRTVLLAYPATPTEKSVLGEVNVFEKIQVDNVNIIGIEVESKGISSKEGMIRFSNKLASNCLRIIEE